MRAVKRRLYGNEIPPCCEYCENARRGVEGRSMLCVRHGVVPPYHHCRRFRYDPLKRVPVRQAAPGGFSEEDFRL